MQRPSQNAITQPFGYDPSYPLNGGNHIGVDFSPYPDSTIYAPEDGVYELRPNEGTMGNSIHAYVGSRHHAFGHTSQYLIKNKQFCKRGTPIAIMGATGAAQGVHLHWALAINGKLVDALQQVNESFIKGGDEVSTVGEVELDMLSKAYFGYGANEDFIKAHKGKETNEMIRWCEANPAHAEWLKTIEAWKNDTGTFVPVGEQLYKKG